MFLISLFYVLDNEIEKKSFMMCIWTRNFILIRIILKYLFFALNVTDKLILIILSQGKTKVFQICHTAYFKDKQRRKLIS